MDPDICCFIFFDAKLHHIKYPQRLFTFFTGLKEATKPLRNSANDNLKIEDVTPL